MNQRFPYLYLSFVSVFKWNHHHHIKIKYFQKDVIREYVDSIHLAYITSRQSIVIAGCRVMKDIRRLRSVRFFRVPRRLFAISKPSKRQYIGIDIQGRLRNGGNARAVLEYGGEI